MGMTASEYRRECLDTVEVIRQDSMKVLNRDDVVDVCVDVAIVNGLVAGEAVDEPKPAVVGASS